MGMVDVLRSLGAEEPLGTEEPLETSEERNEHCRSPTRVAADGWRANGAARATDAEVLCIALVAAYGFGSRANGEAQSFVALAMAESERETEVCCSLPPPSKLTAYTHTGARTCTAQRYVVNTSTMDSWCVTDANAGFSVDL